MSHISGRGGGVRRIAPHAAPKAHLVCAVTVALLVGCQLASGSYATMSVAICAVSGPRSF